MQSFLQFLIIGLGAGATYALVRAGRGAHLPRLGPGQLRAGRDRHLRGVHRVRRPEGKQRWATLPALVVAVIAAGAVSLAFQAIVLRALRRAARDRPGHRDDRPARSPPGRRREALRRRQPTGRLLPPARRCATGAASRSRRSGSTSSAITLVVTFGLWAWTRYTRVGLAISASAAERTGGADARVVARPPRRAHVDDRRDARRARRRARGAAHRAVGDRRSRSW